jgi:two-component system chemotaxis response regulator CheB
MAIHLIAVGASAGGLEALLRIVKGLPPDLPAALGVVVHSSPDFPSMLPQLLSDNGPLPAAHARDEEELRPGRIYVAPPGFHLTVEDERTRVSFGAKVNGFRPAIDPLLRSVADSYGAAAMGVLLSGNLSDGVAGLVAIKRAGGVAVVQEPADAAVPTLPRNALVTVHADHVVSASDMGGLLGRLARRLAEKEVNGMPDTMVKAEADTHRDFAAQERGERAGQVSLFSCPSCGGVMRQTDESRLAEFLCHVGHAYEGETLLAAQAENIENSCWSLDRALKERALLARELINLARGRGDTASEKRLEKVVEDTKRLLGIVQGDLLNGPLWRDRDSELD